jgi:hypothetical protein
VLLELLRDELALIHRSHPFVAAGHTGETPETPTT